MKNGSVSTIFHTEEDITSPTSDPEPSQPPPKKCTEPMPEPTADKEPLDCRDAVTIITPEPVLNQKSDQMRELAMPSVSVGMLVKFEEMEWSPAHTSIAEGELQLTSIKYYEDGEEGYPCSLPSPLVPSSSKSPVSLLVLPSSASPVSPKIPTSLPLPPPLPIIVSSPALLCCFPSVPRLLPCLDLP